MTKIVIVGAGVIGLFCALKLQQRGAHVVVLEGEREDLSQFSPSASLAAAGMLAPVSEAVGAGEHHGQLDALGLDSFDLWRSQSKGALWEDGLRFDGGVLLAADAASASAVQQRAQELGRSVTAAASSQVRKKTGLQARADHALWIEDEGVADPVRVLSGLVMDARRHGVQVLYGHDVEAVTANRVTAYEGLHFEADKVLLAPGVWGSDQMASVAPALKHIRPARGHIVPVMLERPLSANVHGPGFYLARRGEDDVVLGATMEFDRYERHIDPARVDELLAAAERTLPGEVRARTQDGAWVGVRPMSPDWAPMIGPSGEVLVACGHSRNGWLLAPVTADIICAYVFGETPPPLWAAFAPDRFEAQA